MKNDDLTNENLIAHLGGHSARAKCYFSIDTQAICGHTQRHGSHSRWRRGDRKDGDVPTPYSHPFTPFLQAFADRPARPVEEG